MDHWKECFFFFGIFMKYSILSYCWSFFDVVMSCLHMCMCVKDNLSCLSVIATTLPLKKKKDFNYVSVYGYVHSTGAHRDQRHWISWSYSWLWATWHGSWKLILSPLWEHSVLKDWPSQQPNPPWVFLEGVHIFKTLTWEARLTCPRDLRDSVSLSPCWP